jgi:hypothetical protein
LAAAVYFLIASDTPHNEIARHFAPQEIHFSYKDEHPHHNPSSELKPVIHGHVSPKFLLTFHFIFFFFSINLFFVLFLKDNYTPGGRETAQWFNLLLAKIWREHAANEGFKTKWKERINLKLSESKRPDYIVTLPLLLLPSLPIFFFFFPSLTQNQQQQQQGKIAVTDIDFGNNSVHIIDGVKLLKQTVPGELVFLFFFFFLLFFSLLIFVSEFREVI